MTRKTPDFVTEWLLKLFGMNDPAELDGLISAVQSHRWSRIKFRLVPADDETVLECCQRRFGDRLVYQSTAGDPFTVTVLNKPYTAEWVRELKLEGAGMRILNESY